MTNIYSSDILVLSSKGDLYPSIGQQILINKTFGCTRLIYNIMLDKKKNNKSLSCYDLIKEIPSLYKEYPFLKELDSCSLRCAIFDLDNAYQRYYKKLGRYPKYKKKGCKDSYRTNLITSTYKNKVYENIKIDLKNKTITLPKLKEVNIKGYRNLVEINGRIINATITKEGKKYYVSIVVEESVILPDKKEDYTVGIDIGVKSLIVTSDGETYGNPRYNEKYEKRIKKLQRDLTRKIKGSNNYKKAKVNLSEIYRKLSNARKKMVEEIVSKVTKYNDIIITEKLKVKEMLAKKEQNKILRKSIINATFGLIIRKLEEKCKMLNKIFIQVATYYPSSQICSRCGNINKEMKDLRKREYKCSGCGIELDRDINASINIEYEGIIKYYKSKLN